MDAWRRELRFSGCLPLEQGAAFEQAIWNIAKPLRAADKKTGSPLLEWRQYTADALVTLATQPSGADGGSRRSPTTLIVHLSDDGTPPMLEGAGPISPETAERLCCDSRRIAIKLCGSDLLHSRVGRCASYPQLRALYKRSAAIASTRAAPPSASSKPTTSSPTSAAARPRSTTSSCSASATTNSSTTTTSRPADTARNRCSRTRTVARSPPTNPTHHPAETPASAVSRRSELNASGVGHRADVVDRRPDQAVVRSCSRMCAVQPAVRAAANVEG